MNKSLENIIFSDGNRRLRKTRYGVMLHHANDIGVGSSFENYGEFSEGEVELFRQIIRPGATVLDIGANIGSHTLFFAQAVGPQGHVFAFEPQRIVFQNLCANISLNSILNVYCYHAAVGEYAGSIKVPLLDFEKENRFGSLSLGTHQTGENVPVITIDSFQLPHCDFIKIDVEGMEETVLKGCVKTLEKYRPILYVENDRQEKSADLIRYIDSLGYKMYWHLPPLFNPNNFYENKENIFGNIISVDMLCIHRSIQTTLQGFRQVSGPDDNWRIR